MQFSFPHYAERRISPAGLVLVVALHGAAAFALLQMKALPLPLPLELPVLSANLIVPPTPEPARPQVVPPKPQPAEKRPVPRPVREIAPLAVPADIPVPVAVAELPVAVPPAPTFDPPSPPAPRSPAAPSQPRFDADYLLNPKPSYPPLSRRMGEEGQVVLRVKVGADGLPLDVAVDTGSGSARLDRAALDTVRRWKFVPARRGEEAVAATVLVPIVFSLKD